MPKKLHKKVEKQGKKHGLTGNALQRYIYKGLQSVGQRLRDKTRPKPKRKKLAKPGE